MGDASSVAWKWMMRNRHGSYDTLLDFLSLREKTDSLRSSLLSSPLQTKSKQRHGSFKLSSCMKTQNLN